LSSTDDTNPTPSYNFGILADLRMQENNELLKRFLTSKQITDSIQMVKLWLLKRGLNTVNFLFGHLKQINFLKMLIFFFIKSGLWMF